MSHGNAETKKWLFDFDSENSIEIGNFIADLSEYDVHYDVHKTPRGYAIITNHGFDTRKLLKDRDYVTLKRDDMLCFKWKIKC